MVKLYCDLGDRVAAFGGGEDPEFDAPEHVVTQYEIFYKEASSSVTASG